MPSTMMKSSANMATKATSSKKMSAEVSFGLSALRKGGRGGICRGDGERGRSAQV